MTKNDYMLFVFQAVDKARYRGDKGPLEMVADLLVEGDQAKQVLREKGYGVIGTSLLNTVKEVPS